MASNIDATKPSSVRAFTADVRANFAAAKAEIEALQSADGVSFTQSGSGLQETTVQAVIEELATEGASGAMMWVRGDGSILLDPSINEMDATVTRSHNFGAGVTGATSILGKLNALPTGTDFDPGWAVDADYVAGHAGAASIHGGYDQVNNSLASVIVNSDHSMISYGGGVGHSGIFGWSYNWIGDADRATILGARQSRINGGSEFSMILGGDNNDIDATDAGKYVIIGGLNNSITGTSGGCTIINGSSNTASGLNCVILGGVSNTNAERSAVVMGEDAIALVPNGLHIGRDALVEAGDAQTILVPLAVRTTDDTLTNMSATSSQLIEFDDAATTVGTGHIILTAINEADGTQVAYASTFGFMWNGTNGFLFKSGTQTTVTSAPTLDLDLISQTNNDFTAGAAPHIAINTGALRPKVTGIAATNIKWVGSLHLVMTKHTAA